MKTIKRSLQRLAYASGLCGVMLKAHASAPLILMYHGVTVNDSKGLQNRDGKHVPSAMFAQQLRLLKKHRKIIGLTDMIECIRRDDDLRNTVALTLDDGYENNYRQAAKILSDFNVPATFFLTTGYIGENRWMWTDRLEHALDRTERTAITPPGLPGTISLATLAEKEQGLRRIKAHMKLQPGDTCESYVRALERDLGLSEEEPYGDYRFMSWQQARELSDAGFEIGAHSVNHPILSRIRREDAFSEILVSRDKIQTELGKCSKVYCYPNGKSDDYTSEIMDFCQLHFRAALSTNVGPVRRADLYELNRIGISSSTTPSNFAWRLFREW